MKKIIDLRKFTATDIRIALNEIFPESTYGAVPVMDQYDALQAYHGFDDNALAEAPEILIAFGADR